MKYKRKAKLISNIQTTFQSFHCKVASYTKSKPKKVNESRLKKIIKNESNKYKIRDNKKIHLITKGKQFGVLRRGSMILKWGVNFCNNVIEPKPG